MGDALASWHMGRVIHAYRRHPFHGRVLPQEVVAGWVGITQAQLSRLESGPPMTDLSKLIHWARALGIPSHLLWFKLPDQRREETVCEPSPSRDDRVAATVVQGTRQETAEADDMKRRELLRLMSLAGTLMATVQIEGIDWERLEHDQAGSGRLDAVTVNEYQALNSHLWRVFVLAKSKSAVMPFVRDQLEVLVSALRRSHGPSIHQRLCALAGELFQLAGEIYFDCNDYTSAAHCYTLSATASKEANAFDLWACALTRHAYINVYEERFQGAEPVLELAAALASQGDSRLSTRHWVAAVQAETFAGLGDLDACQQALDTAELVGHLKGSPHNGGWLRFDGSRLEEQRGTCYVQLGQADRADAVLTKALSRNLSTRRRGSVLTDLAMVGTLRKDPAHVTSHVEAALAIARQTGSGFIAQKLRSVQAQLTPFLTDRRIRRISNQVTALST